ncbi:Multicopper oxidase [Lachnellula suecica]|uniref:Multicopper oxidase n=1 Tax=Lachnellula suecica TaxID=602035 RepID=A0A8T9CJW1_9HELO|nr:Multicopper oxidase [Lachnellula suecica]
MYLVRICLAYLHLITVATSLDTHSHDDSFTPDAVLRVTRQNTSIGGINRYTTLVNNSLPGPPLRIPENQVVWIRVYNDMTDDNLTMHWHGLAQAAYPFSDGTPLASQWPIPPLHFFDYELQTPNDTAGSYYYHSHVGFQTSTAAGPLIVEDPVAPPYEFDGERIIFLQEFWNHTDQEIVKGLESTPLNWPGETNGWLINGKTISDWGAVNRSSEALSVIDIEPGKKYRFRCIAATSLSLAIFAFENHTSFDIIEADGSYTQPNTVNLLQMGSGQRYDVLFQAKTCDELKQLGKLDYYMQLESRERLSVVTNYAVLRYTNSCNFTGSAAKNVSTKSNPDEPPLVLPPTINGFLDYALKPIIPNNFPSASEVTRRVIINIQLIEDQYYTWLDNGIDWTEDGSDPLNHTTPAEPYLVSLYNNQTANLPNYEAAVNAGGLDPVTKTYPAKIGEVIEIVFQQLGAHTYDGEVGGSLDFHPWHAHGNHFWDAGGGDGVWNSSVVEQQLAGTQPVLRDTTILYRYNESTGVDEKKGWRVWRLRIDDPGVWMVHCHTLQHMIMGMQTVWVHGDAKDILTVPRPDVEGYLTYGGNVNGNSSHAPQVLHFSELDGA